MSKIWLCGITRSIIGNAENLEELLAPIYNYFDGLVWVYHADKSKPMDGTYNILKRYLKEGKIEYVEWYHRFDFARNHYLFNGRIAEGDWFVNIDTEERLTADFCKKLPKLIEELELEGVDGCYLYNKFFMFKFNEDMKFVNTIHEGLHGVKNGIELSNREGYTDKESYHTNVRGEKRGEHDFVLHHLRYYMTPASIHCLLKCENDRFLFEERQKNRIIFRELVKLNKIDVMDIDSVVSLINNYKNYKGRAQILDLINSEKILNDVYRLYTLEDKSVKEDFDFKNLTKIS